MSRFYIASALDSRIVRCNRLKVEPRAAQIPQPAPSLATRDDVASLLGLPLKKVTWWAWGIPDTKRYEQFEIARRSGGEPRPIHAPVKPLKDIQRRLAQVLSECYRPPPNVHGFTNGRSPVSNASPHPRQQWVMRVDLKDFFPSINFFRVRGMFGAFPFEYPDEVAALLAQLCCHQNALPQGAPTSPIVSNYICRGMDRQLGHLAIGERCYFTRYADDLSFSTDRKTFPATLGYVDGGETVAGDAVTNAIEVDHGFAINAEKTRLMHKSQRQRVTGLVVNEKVNIPRTYIRSLRNLLYIWQRYGKADAEEALARFAPRENWPPGKPMPSFAQTVRGRVQYVGSIKGWANPTYRGLATALSEVDESFTLPEIVEKPKLEVRLFMEGPTDVIHFEEAIKALDSHPALRGFDFKFEGKPYFEGDGGLLSACRAAAKFPQDPPYLFVFDSDNSKILRQAVRNGTWKDWKNGVVAVALAPPAWREDKRLCIEMLYDDATLAWRDSEGRRLYFFSEFDTRNGQHLTEECYMLNPKNKTLVRDDVHRFKSKQSIGLSKMAFAEAVRDRAAGFGEISFEGFIPTFERIQEALNSMVRPPGVSE